MNYQLYLAYGSNLNVPQMAIRCPDAIIVASVMVEGYELLFRGGGSRSAVATIEPAANKRVPALIWAISESDEEALDYYEGYPRLYRKEILTVDIDGRPTEVMAYVMNEGYALGEPSSYYLDVIREGYNAAGFDDNILDEAVLLSAARK